jgi:hypothetical protein
MQLCPMDEGDDKRFDHAFRLPLFVDVHPKPPASSKLVVFSEKKR